MTAIKVKIKALSPVHFSSGQADVNVDAEVIHDRYGMPYLPAKRFKGLLLESAREIKEMGERSGMTGLAGVNLARLFHQGGSRTDKSVAEESGSEREVQIVVPNFFLEEREEYDKMCRAWEEIQRAYRSLITPKEVLEEYTSVRYQTKLKDGVAFKGSLHNMRAVNPGVVFRGTVELLGERAEEYLGFLLLSVKNIRSVGMKRNRGFGSVACHVCLADGRDAEAVAAAYLEREAKGA